MRNWKLGRDVALVGLVGLLIALAWGYSPVAATTPDIVDIEFAQLDWFGPDGSLAQADSLYGQMGWSYDPDPTTTYYLNVNVALTSGGPASWVTQNLPLFAVDNDDFSTRSEGVYFNLAELGLTAGTDLSQIYYSVTVDSTIRTTDPGPAVTFAVVETLERRATDSPDESPDPGPFVDPGEPEGVKLDAAPAKQNKARDVKGVQEGNSKCCAGAFARSIDWLNRKHKLGMTKNAQQIYDDLIAAGVSQPGLGGPNSRDEWIERKNQYARAQTGKRIVTKVWERTASTVDETEGVNQETGDFANWLKREIKSEDVEVAYFYPGNAHIVTVLEVYTKGGDTYVKYRDDEEQSDNTKGDGKGGAKYPAVKHARIYKKNGKYHFGSDKNTIYFAVSESVPEVDSFPNSKAKVTMNTPFGSDTLTLTGPTTVHVFIGPDGQVADTDGDGREQVQTEIVQMELTGTSALLGRITVRLRDPEKHPFQRSTGEIEEFANNTPGVLDLPPFTDAGTAESFFDVFFEIEIPELSLRLHNDEPKRMRTTITHKPPAPGETYESPEVIPLLDESENPTGVEIAATFHTPIPITIGGVPEPVDKVKLVGALIAPYLGPAFVLLLTAGALVVLFKRRKTS